MLFLAAILTVSVGSQEKVAVKERLVWESVTRYCEKGVLLGGGVVLLDRGGEGTLIWP